MVSWTKPDQAWSSLELDMNSSLKTLLCKLRDLEISYLHQRQYQRCREQMHEDAVLLRVIKDCTLVRMLLWVRAVRLRPLLLLPAVGHRPFLTLPLSAVAESQWSSCGCLRGAMMKRQFWLHLEPHLQQQPDYLL